MNKWEAVFLVSVLGCKNDPPKPSSSATETALAAPAEATGESKSTPHDTFKAMHEAACAHNRDHFFDHIDRKEMRIGTREIVAASMHAEPASKNLTADQVEKLIDSTTETVFNETMDGWRADIGNKSGPADICAWVDIGGDGETVKIRRVSGKTSTLRFSKATGEWLMVRYATDD